MNQSNCGSAVYSVGITMGVIAFGIILGPVAAMADSPSNTVLAGNAALTGLQTFEDTIFGATPPPWTASVGAGAFVGVTNISSFGGGTKSFLITTPTGIASAAGNLASNWQPQTNMALTVDFDWRKTAGVGNEVVFRLMDVGNQPGVQLQWGNSNMAYTSSNGVNQVLMPFTVNTWYHFRLDVPAASSPVNLFNLTVTPDGGSSTTFSSLLFRNFGVVEFSKASFNAGSGGGPSDIMVDNFQIITIPEPSSLLLGGLGWALIAFRRRFMTSASAQK